MNNPYQGLIDQITAPSPVVQPKMQIEMFDVIGKGRYLRIWMSPGLMYEYRRTLWHAVSDLAFQIGGRHWAFHKGLLDGDEVTICVKPYRSDPIKADM